MRCKIYMSGHQSFVLLVSLVISHGMDNEEGKLRVQCEYSITRSIYTEILTKDIP